MANRFLDVVGFLTSPVAVMTPGERRQGQRYEPGLDSGDPFQATPSAGEPTSSTFQEAAENLFAPSYIAYGCIDAYASVIASLPRRIYRKVGRSDREEVDEGDLYELFMQPSPHRDGFEFWHALVTSYLVGGEAPIEKVRNLSGTRVVQMNLLRPDRFGPIVNSDQGLVGYQYVVGTNGYGYEIDEIMFVKTTNPTNEWRGLSPLTAARLSLESDLFAARYNRNYYINGAIPGGVLQTDQDLIKRERAELRGEWEALHRGVNRAGRVAVLDKGLKFDGTALSQRDSQWLESRQMDQEAVCVALHTPPEVIGISRSTNRATADVQFRAWLRGPVRWICERLEAKFNWQLVREFGRDLVMEFDMREVMRPEFEERMRALSLAWWWSRDEKRREDNLPAWKGEDELYVPVNMSAGGAPVNEVVPIDQLPGAGKVPPQLMPPEGEEPAEVAKAVTRPFGR